MKLNGSFVAVGLLSDQIYLSALYECKLSEEYTTASKDLFSVCTLMRILL